MNIENPTEGKKLEINRLYAVISCKLNQVFD